MMRTDLRHTARFRAALVGAASVVILLAAWEAAVRLGNLPEFVLPSPSQVVTAGVDQAPALGQHVSTTATEAVLGLALGTALGWLLAVLASAIPTAGHVARPVVLLSQ